MEDQKVLDVPNKLELLVADFVEAYRRLHHEDCKHVGGTRNAKRAASDKRSRNGVHGNVEKPQTPREELQDEIALAFKPRIPKIFSKPLTPRSHFKEPDLDKLYDFEMASCKPSFRADIATSEEDGKIAKSPKTADVGHLPSSSKAPSSVCMVRESRSNSSVGGSNATPPPPSLYTHHPLQGKETRHAPRSTTDSQEMDSPTRGRTPRVLTKLIEDADTAKVTRAHTLLLPFHFLRRLRKKLVNARHLSREAFVETILDPIVCFVIVMNLLLTGVSLDQEEWSGWYVLDWVFAIIYILELCLKLLLLGWEEMYFGRLWAWSAFDTIVVMLALLDLLIEASGSITMVRVARLFRIARLLRLMKIPALKELIMLVRGMFRGMRVLFWCLSALLLPVFIVGMLVSQILKDSDQDIDGNFSTVPISMFTTIRCMCGDCNDSLGRPLIVLFSKEFGWHFAFFYSLFILVSIFGIFNLITAIFLEGTMQAAKSDTNLQRGIRNASDKKFACNIKHLVYIFWQAHKLRMFGGVSGNTNGWGSSNQLGARTTQPDSEGSIKRKTAGSFGRATILIDKRGVDKFDIKDALELEIDQAFYDDMVLTDTVRDILDDMGLVDDDIVDLFEMLDVDRSGTLDLTELVTGLYRLRGEATKRDLVALAYMVYSLQDSVRAVLLSLSRINGQDIETLTEDARGGIPSPVLAPGASRRGSLDSNEKVSSLFGEKVSIESMMREIV